jgi:hypothetical protein
MDTMLRQSALLICFLAPLVQGSRLGISCLDRVPFQVTQNVLEVLPNTPQ